MLYLILATDKPNTDDLRASHRQTHVDYWLAFGNRVKLAGPWLQNDAPDSAPKGSMIMVEATDLTAAKELANQDPYLAAGIFETNIFVEPLRIALGQWKAK